MYAHVYSSARLHIPNIDERVERTKREEMPMYVNHLISGYIKIFKEGGGA